MRSALAFSWHWPRSSFRPSRGEPARPWCSPLLCEAIELYDYRLRPLRSSSAPASQPSNLPVSPTTLPPPHSVIPALTCCVLEGTDTEQADRHAAALHACSQIAKSISSTARNSPAAKSPFAA